MESVAEVSGAGGVRFQSALKQYTRFAACMTVTCRRAPSGGAQLARRHDARPVRPICNQSCRPAGTTGRN